MIKDKINIRWIALSFLILICLVPGSAFAQGSGPTDDDVNAIAKQLYCPVCENIPLDACGTQACEQWRGIIRDRLAEGWTEEQITPGNFYGGRVFILSWIYPVADDRRGS